MSSGRDFKSNVSYAVASNLSVAVISALATLVIPKIIGVEEYGYWQLFVFYGTYALLLQLGAGDGANLRYGGLSVDEIRQQDVGRQTVLVGTGTAVCAVFCAALAPFFVSDPDRLRAVQLAGFFACAVNGRHFVQMLMQAVSDFRTYSRVTIIDRLAFALLVCVFLLAGSRDAWVLAVVEISVKAASLLLAIYLARRVLGGGAGKWRRAWSELLANVGVGLKLTMANTANLLILGVFRFLIDRAFGVVVFGAVSFVLNLSSFFMVFVNAVGFVLFPALRRIKSERLPTLYGVLRTPLAIAPVFLLLVSHPITLLANLWLPEYAVALQFIPILLMMIVFEAKMGLLVIPYLKALRGENALLGVNVAATCFSFVLAVLSTLILRDLGLAVAGVVLALAFRAVAAECILLRRLGLSVPKSFWWELGLLTVYGTLHTVCGGWAASLIFAGACGVLLLVFRKAFAQNVHRLLEVLRQA